MEAPLENVSVRLSPEGWMLVNGDKEAGPFPYVANIDVREVAAHLGVEPKHILQLQLRIDKFSVATVTGSHKAEEAEESLLTWRRIERFNPACGILEGNPEPQLCVTVPLSAKVLTKRRGEEEWKEKVLPHMVLSPSKRVLVANEETLERLGVYNYAKPELPEERWSQDSLRRWKFYGGSADKRETYLQLKETFEHYLDCVESGMYSYIPLWALGTYFSQLFATYPRMALTGTRESGKGKVLKFLYCTAFNAEWTMNLSAASLFRTAESLKATLLCDEMEGMGDPERRQELRSFINSSYERGPQAKRTDKQTGKQQRFNTFVPIALGAIQGYEGVLESRAIVFTMLRTASEKANREITLEAPIWRELRDNLHTLLMTEWQNVKAIYDGYTRCPIADMHGRDWQLWRPMLALAEWIGDPRLKAQMYTLAHRKTAYRRDKDQFEMDEIILLKTLKDMVVADDWWPLGTIKDNMTVCYGDEAPKHVDTRYVAKLLARMNWEERKKEDKRWLYRICVKEVVDRCRRYGILEEEVET